MRRSAAPSARKFNSPTLSINKTIVNDNLTSKKESTTKQSETNNLVRSTSTVLQLLNKKKEVNNENIPNEKTTDVIVPDIISDNRIYNIVWGKKSTKKHKTWEGDGTLIVGQRCATLKDEEGKYLGKLTNINTDKFEEGHILSIGGKEVQIIELISKEPIQNKKRRNTEKEEIGIQPPKKVIRRNFISKKSSPSVAGNDQPLVLPQPSLEHQWLNNKKKLPVTDVYVQPSIAKVLRPHQKQGVVFLYECVMGYRLPGYHGAILADEMGLGKTLQCITIIWILLKQGPYGGIPVINRTLVVAPSSLIGNWNKEITRWLGQQKLQVFTVDSKNKPKDYQTKFLHVPIMIISYEMFVRYSQQIQEINFDLLVCDEGHRLKNDSIKLTTFLNQLECKRRIILSGTPIQNDLQEFYSLTNFVNPGVLGTNIEYRRQYIEPIVASREPDINEDCKKLGEERASELNRKTGVFVLRRTQDILEKFLPTKTELVVFCKSSELQKQLYSIIVDCWKNRESNHFAHLSVIIALKKICNHPCLLKNDPDDKLMSSLTNVLPDLKTVHIDDSGKLQVLSSLLEQLFPLGEKIVIVSSYTQTLDIIGEMCDHKGYKHGRLDGGTATNKRTGLVEKFNDLRNDCFVFLLSAKAGGVGLNLIGASRLVLFDSDWNPATDLQAMARVWRDGQKKSVFLYRFLTTGTIEEKIYQRQISKVGLSGAVVDPEARNSIRLSDEELKDLFAIEYDCEGCSTHTSLGCSCSGDGTIPKPKSGESRGLIKERSCQLGGPDVNTRESGLRMNQLMHWEHHSVPFAFHVIKEAALIDCQELLLCEHKMKWVHSSNGQVPHGAVQTGKTSTGEALYVARAYNQGRQCVGKLHPSHRTCYIPFGGKEHSYNSYEVLVSRN